MNNMDELLRELLRQSSVMARQKPVLTGTTSRGALSVALPRYAQENHVRVITSAAKLLGLAS